MDGTENIGRGGRLAGISPAMKIVPWEGPGSPARLLAAHWGFVRGASTMAVARPHAASRARGSVTRAEENTRGWGCRDEDELGADPPRATSLAGRDADALGSEPRRAWGCWLRCALRPGRAGRDWPPRRAGYRAQRPGTSGSHEQGRRGGGRGDHGQGPTTQHAKGRERRREGEAETHLRLVTAETSCLPCTIWIWGKTGGYATAGWIYIKRASAGDDCRICRQLR
jgi:hypothetical protein